MRTAILALPLAISTAISVAPAQVAKPPSSTASPAAPPATPPTRRPTTLPISGYLNAHDPSTILKDGDTYFLASTGRGLTYRSSKDLLTWTRENPIFSQPPAWAPTAIPGFKDHLWAPELYHDTDPKTGDGKFYLFYSVSTFGSQTSSIAVASSPTLDPRSPNYAWTDHGPILTSQKGDPYNAIDPSLLRDPKDGRLYLAFGSFWNGLYLFELDAKTKKPNSPPIHLAKFATIEAPTLYFKDGWYYLFFNHGLCCKGINSTYTLHVGRSKSITGPYIDKDDKDLRTGGGTLLLGNEDNAIGPGHISFVTSPTNIPLITYHFYDAQNNGRPTLALRPLHWTADGWPTLSLTP